MRVLFLGEGPLEGPARYLRAVLTWSRIPFDHRPDRSPIPKAWRGKRYDAVILSDYRYNSWTLEARRWLTQTVVNGTGLMMLGGWASFMGLVGRYSGTDIEMLLPVQSHHGDDRINAPALLTNGRDVSVVVNGYHRTRTRPGSKTHLIFRDLKFSKGKPILGSSSPGLVTGLAGSGRTCAFMTDCAPHWAGGLIDWGGKRVNVAIGRDQVVETGNRYLEFFKHWILWSCRKSA